LLSFAGPHVLTALKRQLKSNNTTTEHKDWSTEWG